MNNHEQTETKTPDDPQIRQPDCVSPQKRKAEQQEKGAGAQHKTKPTHTVATMEIAALSSMVGSPEVVYRGGNGKWACERGRVSARLVKRNGSSNDQLSKLKLPKTAFSQKTVIPKKTTSEINMCKSQTASD